ncbi:Cyclic phosphodiesterase [Linum perenne]
MDGLRSEFGGPEFQPHVTVVGAVSLTEQDALNKFKSACEGVKAYTATVDRVAAGTFFYHFRFQVVEASSHCSEHFGFKNSTRKFVFLTS